MRPSWDPLETTWDQFETFWDPKYFFSIFQVVVCANNLSSSCCGFLLREMISMFDKCTKKSENLTKNQNLEFLACTEIRKANLTSCNFAVNLTRKDAKFAIDNQHQVSEKISWNQKSHLSSTVWKFKNVSVKLFLCKSAKAYNLWNQN